jgi:kinesin family member 20
MDISLSSDDIDSTSISLDRNYEYTIWLSYAEVYNEKVYDLLQDEEAQTSKATAGRTASVLTRKALALRPCQLSGDDDPAVRGKYISGLRQFRVQSAAEAKELVRLGQLNRRVFGTVANRESSRSHGMVILSVVRGHRGERNVKPFNAHVQFIFLT